MDDMCQGNSSSVYYGDIIVSFYVHLKLIFLSENVTFSFLTVAQSIFETTILYYCVNIILYHNGNC